MGVTEPPAGGPGGCKPERAPAVSKHLALLKLDVESAEFSTLLAAAASGALWPRV